jgi:hypothetical protein
MSTFEKHCEESIRLFGQPFEQVHLWLDEFQGTPEYGMRHRRVRHHEAGIQEAIKLFGKKAGDPSAYNFRFKRGGMDGTRSISQRRGRLYENRILLE